MIDDALDRTAGFVTAHNRIVVLLMLVLTGAMVVGTSELDTGSQAGGTTEVFPETDVSAAADYVQAAYAEGPSDGGNTAAARVYVRAPGGNALSKTALLEALRYQQEIRGTDAVADHFRAAAGVPNLVATRAAGDPSATLADQIAALEATSPDRVAALVESTLGADSPALALLPRSFEPGTATAESHRMIVRFAAGPDGAPPSEATAVLHRTAEAQERLDVFTLGEHARAENSRVLTENTIELVLPAALVCIIAVLAFAYRDLVDVVVGLVGVVTSIVWMFGILGWLGVAAGMTMLIGPVLVAGLSIDFGFHVFTRYREQRTDGGAIRRPMRRALRGVAVALGLVTITAAIGFLSNVVNPVGSIRDLGVGITLGVAAAFVVFVTLVPALKISIEGLLDRAGLDRRKRPLGEGRFVRPLLASSVTLARRAAPVVLVVALVASGAGAAAWTGLEEQSFQQQSDPAAEWKQDLPGPLGWEVPAYQHDSQYVQEAYAPVASGADERFQLLVRGDVTASETLSAVDDVTDRAVFHDERTGASLLSPLTVIRDVAAENEAVAATVATADSDGDGVPDTELTTVYDALFEHAPDRASRVIERRDGRYHSIRVVGPAESAGFTDDRSATMRAAASALDDRLGDATATAVSRATVLTSQLGVVTDGILRVLVLALATVVVALVLVYRVWHGSATLGALSAAPILMVTGLVIGVMYLLDVPLTLVTALLMSLVVGLGIDYNIHVSDRFLQERERGRPPMAALETAVTGTGGALLGSTLTSAGAFAALLLHPHPQMQSFGLLVILTLVTSLLVSVVVLPSILTLWIRHGRRLPGPATGRDTAGATADD